MTSAHTCTPQPRARAHTQTHTQVLAGKTVVLATNQLQFVSMADVVVVMRGGTAVEVGSYADLLAAGGVFAALMKEAQVCACVRVCACVCVCVCECVGGREGGERVARCQEHQVAGDAFT
jgi:hypothetical protein